MVEAGEWDSGTVAWKKMEKLELKTEGDDVEMRIEEKGIYFY